MAVMADRMPASGAETWSGNARLARSLIYVALIIFALWFLLPLFVMLVNSVKPLDEIRGGNMLALPDAFTIEPWRKAWSSAQVGIDPSGLSPYFWNSIKMVLPAVVISSLLGALNGYILTKWRFAGHNVADRFGRPAAALAVHQHHRETAMRPFDHLQRIPTLTGGIFTNFGDGKLQFHRIGELVIGDW